MKVSLISDEYTADPFTAFELGRKWGFENFEIRQAYRWRVPVCPKWVADRTVAAVGAYGVNVTAISPGLFKPTMKVDGSQIPVSVDTPDEIRRQVDELLPGFFEFAERLGTRNIIVFALGREAGSEGRPVPSTVVGCLAEAAAKAEEAGFQLLLENGPASWADSGRNAREIIEKVGSEALRLTWDPANVAKGESSEEPVAEGYPLVREYVRNVHVKDTAVIEGKTEWAMLGDGVVDWPKQISLLKADGYAGFLTCEPHLQYAKSVNLISQMETFLSRLKALLA